MNLSHVATLQNEVKSWSFRADLGITNFLIDEYSMMSHCQGNAKIGV